MAASIAGNIFNLQNLAKISGRTDKMFKNLKKF